MADLESHLREGARLSEENDLIKAKYKKSLQELMHILKVNKSLKECLDAQTKTLEDTLASQLAEVRRNHQQELETYRRELEQYKHMLAQESLRSQGLERAQREREEEVGETEFLCKTLQERVKELEGQPKGRGQSNPAEVGLASESVRAG
jgi:replication fork clamp-binding protein CrfC